MKPTISNQEDDRLSQMGHQIQIKSNKEMNITLGEIQIKMKIENIRQQIENSSNSMSDSIVEETVNTVFKGLKDTFENIDYDSVNFQLKQILTKELVLDTMYYKDCISYLAAQISNIRGFRGTSKEEIKKKTYELINSLNRKEPVN